MIVGVIAVLLGGRAPAQASPAPFLGTIAAPQVHVVLSLGDSNLHPRQLAYDRARSGLWFWTSTQHGGLTYANTVYFYSIGSRQLHSWPIYSGDWSSQLLSGIAVAPDGDVWIGWNRNLLRFYPQSGTYLRYVLPAQPRYPLPAAVLGNLPAGLGIADLAVSRDGTVWIARYAALSLTAFSPATATFAEYPLPNTSGDPAALAIAPNGHVLFTTDLAANHPGYANESIEDFDPATHTTVVAAQAGRVLAVAPSGDLYVPVGRGSGLARLSASAQIASHALGRAPVFQQRVLPFDTDNTAIATDDHGRVWVAVAGQPDLAVYDPAAGTLREYQYAAPSVAAHPIEDLPLGVEHTTPAPGAVWITHIVAMVCDAHGDLWYIRAGSDELEEVTP